MKNVLYMCLLLCCLASCARHEMLLFSTSGGWTQQGNVVGNSDLKIDFGDGLLSNAGDGGYDLNFITSQDEFDAYEPKLATYLADIVKRIPLKVDSVDVIFTDDFMILSIASTSKWMPDYVRQANGAFLTVEAIPVVSLEQPEDELWRNLIVDKSKRQIIVVDRIVKKGKHYAIVYILQSESKSSPYMRNIHYDITNPHNIQSVGTQLEALMETSLLAAQLSYGQYIMQADSCYMNGDYEGASNAFEKAFGKKNEIQVRHLYNGACAAARAGFVDVAFERLFALLEKDANWYVDDPNRDQDLANLHKFVQWNNYCDIVAARRDRIEAHYDKPLRKKLHEIGSSDQEVRYALLNAYNQQPRDQNLIDSIAREMNRVDSINRVEICNILDTKGFVGSDKVGDACNVFWLIIQHSPLEMQQKYFPLFVAAMQRGDIPKSHVALMDDRIAMFEGRPQKYGSQIIENGQGQKEVWQLLDPTKVDQWRQEMDLPPLSDYLKQMGVE